MEIQLYALQNLIGNINQITFDAFSNISTSLGSFKKHRVEKTHGHEELSLYVNFKSYTKDPELVDKALTQLKEESGSWSLPVGEILVKGNVISLKLSRAAAFQTVLREVFASGEAYGERTQLKSKVLVVGQKVRPSDSLTSLRIQLLVGVAKNILKALGYQVVSEESDEVDLEIHYSTRHADPSVAWAQCNRVFTKNGQECQLTIEEFYKLREEDMRALSGHKSWDQDGSHTIQALAKAAVTIDLVQVKASQPVKIDTEHVVAYGIRESTSKGAPFIMYNFVRLRAIQNKYHQGVAKGTYPPLPDVKDIDTSLLQQEEEWQLLFDYLLDYPSMLSSISKNASSGDINQHTLCSFLVKMCHCISVYYKRVHILQEPKPHLIPTIHARLMLLKGVEATLNHACKMLNIVPVEFM